MPRLITTLTAVAATFCISEAVASCSNNATKAGQRVIFSYPGLTPPDHLYELTRQGKVGGIILFGENIGNNTASVIADLHEAYRSSECTDTTARLLIMTDQEGGQVRRIPGAGPFESAKEMGQSSDPGAAAKQGGTEAAEALISDGINTNLAPVVDVYRKEGNFIDGPERSFGNTTSLVSNCASAFIRSQQKSGVVATAKHFPGLGAAPAGANTDLSPVTINLTLDELRSVDIAVYRSAMEAAVDMIMTSWAVYPALDKEYPAGLSSKWVQGELRDRLGYKGVVVTDALEAGSLTSFGGTDKRAVLAAKAGADLLLASGRDVDQGEEAVNALEAALSSGELGEKDFMAATERITLLRQKVNI